MASQKQEEFWLKMLRQEVDSMERRLLVKKQIIQELESSIKRKKKKKK